MIFQTKGDYFSPTNSSLNTCSFVLVLFYIVFIFFYHTVVFFFCQENYQKILFSFFIAFFLNTSKIKNVRVSNLGGYTLKLIKQAINFHHQVGELTGYLPDNFSDLDSDRKRTTFLICAGGGYGFVSNREGEPIALKLVGEDYNAFVLNYSVGPDALYPTALCQLAQSLTYIRDNSEAFHVDSEKIILCGFSAGGHLAACLATFWQEDFLKENGFVPEKIQPNGLVLAYPVITSGEFAHRGSFENLLGEGASDKELLEQLSLEKQVNEKIPTTFMWQTYEDPAVPVENSLLYAQALRSAHVPLEYHLFPHGGHGLSLATEVTNSKQEQVAQWIPLLLTWVHTNF